MAAKKKARTIVVPMPAFGDPNLPEAAGGSINFGTDSYAPMDEHPVKHSDDYGAGIDEQTRDRNALPQGTANESSAQEDSSNRDEWSKDQWKELADSYGLPVSGNKDELIERVTEHEASEGGQ